VLALGPTADWPVPIVRTEAVRGEGWRSWPPRWPSTGRTSRRRGRCRCVGGATLLSEVVAIATHRMRRELEESIGEDEEVRELLDRVVSRELDPASAATIILERERERAKDAS